MDDPLMKDPRKSVMAHVDNKVQKKKAKDLCIWSNQHIALLSETRCKIFDG